MKKKNLTKEEKKERNVKILKICLYGGGLLLCAGAFVSLLVIGIRGCAATPKSSSNGSSEVAAQTDSINNALSNDYPIQNSTTTYLLNSTISAPVSAFRSAGVNVGDEGYYQIQLPGGVYGDAELGDYNVYHTFNYLTYYYKRNSNGHVLRYYFGDESDNLFYGVTILNNSVSVSSNSLTGAYLVFNYSPIRFLQDYSNSDNNLVSIACGNLLSLLVDYLPCGYDYQMNFANIINPFAPINKNYTYFADKAQTGSSSYCIFEGLFQSGVTNKFYTSISITYADGYNTWYGDLSLNTPIANQTSGTLKYVNLVYYSPASGTEVVNIQNYAQIGNQYGMVLSNSWINNAFQSIYVRYVVNDFSDYQQLNETSNLDRFELLSAFNNGTEAVGNNGYNVVSNGGMYGVFDLLSEAFYALTPLFSVEVLPGIMLGALVFVPLVGTIILFVVWLFKR